MTRKFWPSFKLGFDVAVEVSGVGDEVEVEVPGEDMLQLQRTEMK